MTILHSSISTYNDNVGGTSVSRISGQKFQPFLPEDLKSKREMDSMTLLKETATLDKWDRSYKRNTATEQNTVLETGDMLSQAFSDKPGIMLDNVRVYQKGQNPHGATDRTLRSANPVNKDGDWRPDSANVFIPGDEFSLSHQPWWKTKTVSIDAGVVERVRTSIEPTKTFISKSITDNVTRGSMHTNQRKPEIPRHIHDEQHVGSALRDAFHVGGVTAASTDVYVGERVETDPRNHIQINTISAPVHTMATENLHYNVEPEMYMGFNTQDKLTGAVTTNATDIERKAIEPEFINVRMQNNVKYELNTMESSNYRAPQKVISTTSTINPDTYNMSFHVPPQDPDGPGVVVNHKLKSSIKKVRFI